MSIGNSDQEKLNGYASPVATFAESLLACLSDIVLTTECIETENNYLLDVGCYMYRISPAIMELQKTEYIPENAIEILESLSNSIHMTKIILGKLQKDERTFSGPKLTSSIKQLEGAINHIGEDLGLITPSTFGDQKYAEIAVRSLSEEMKNARFGTSQITETSFHMQLAEQSSQEDRSEMSSVPSESDLLSISAEVSEGNSNSSHVPHLVEILKSSSKRSQGSYGSMSNTRSSSSLREAAQYVEPLYRSFFCPLTKQIMKDPVTIQSGITYERTAITEWFERISDSEELSCPVTGQQLQSRVLSSNVALKATLDEWNDRNEMAKLKVIRSALSVASTDNMVYDALKDLRDICQRRPEKVIDIRNAGMIPLLVQTLMFKDRKVRCTTLEILRQLADKDDEGKELIAKTTAITMTVKMISSGYQPIRHAALLFLIELSQSQSLAEKIGWVTGGILILIRTKYDRSTDTFASEAADQILRNLARSPKNIKCMAENGFIEPLLDNLIEGTEEIKFEMANYLGEIVVGHDVKACIAQRAPTALLQMVHNGNSPSRKAAFKALSNISSYRPNGRILVESGVLQLMVEEIFTRKIHNEAVNSLKEAATILANILESDIEIESIKINCQGHTVDSDYFVYNIIYMIKSSTSDILNLSLIRILLRLTESHRTAAIVVSAVKEREASYTLVELLNHPNEELATKAIKLLISLSPHIGHTLIDRLCKTNGQPESLIHKLSDENHITERQALSIKFLAKLPHQNLTLNLALLSKDIVPIILHTSDRIQRCELRPSSYTDACLEGIVGILVRFTATIYEPQMLYLAINFEFTKVFTNFLQETASAEVKRLASTGLEKLSSQSINLSKPPKTQKNKLKTVSLLPKFLSRVPSTESVVSVCQVHKGVCSSKNTFCLIEARAIEGLLACLDNQNVEVVEAALSAICTLLDDKVDVHNSINILNNMNAIQSVMKAVRDHNKESLLQKAFWMIERFLMIDGNRSVAAVAQDRWFAATVVSAFHHSDVYTRQMAEKILRYLDKMPSFSTTSTFTAYTFVARDVLERDC